MSTQAYAGHAGCHDVDSTSAVWIRVVPRSSMAKLMAFQCRSLEIFHSLGFADSVWRGSNRIRETCGKLSCGSVPLEVIDLGSPIQN